VVGSELEAMTGQWFYVISANNKRDRKSNEVACGSDIIRASIRPATLRPTDGAYVDVWPFGVALTKLLYAELG